MRGEDKGRVVGSVSKTKPLDAQRRLAVTKTSRAFVLPSYLDGWAEPADGYWPSKTKILRRRALRDFLSARCIKCSIAPA